MSGMISDEIIVGFFLTRLLHVSKANGLFRHHQPLKTTFGVGFLRQLAWILQCLLLPTLAKSVLLPLALLNEDETVNPAQAKDFM